MKRFFLRLLEYYRGAKYWLLYAPAEKRGDRLRRCAVWLRRQLTPAAIAGHFARLAHRLRGEVRRRLNALAAEKALQSAAHLPAGYDVICLPIIPWHSRFQRPQQLMRQYARAGHRVYYAAFRFHAGGGMKAAPIETNVVEVSLPGPPGINVYGQVPQAEDVRRMLEAFAQLRRQQRITSAVVVVQLPFWTPLAERLREQFGWPLVYDCMDEHAGFSTNQEEMLSVEQRLVNIADMVVVTSQRLEEKVRPIARHTVLIRNGCEYEHFAAAAAQGKKLGSAPPTIGFYGAIAEWFDADLTADLAQARPDWRFELIGSTYTGDVSRLEKPANVVLLGERPYADLPKLTAHWDCFLIPFKRLPLTEATNPVKVYEMLATGKPVVAVSLPELRPMAEMGLIRLADDVSAMAGAIEDALAENDPPLCNRRREFAAANTWQERWRRLDAAVRELFPPATVIVVTYNNLPLSKLCLESIFQRTDYPNFEVIVVDNASTDGTPQWLTQKAQEEPRLRLILNAENRGFAAANNQALRLAQGRFLCLLNNDTVVTRGWLSTLIGYLQQQPGVGMVGPVSNAVGNAAKVPVAYRNLKHMHRWAEEYCRRHQNVTEPIDMLGFFCVAMRRDVFRKVGELDEQFGLGYFEDDDYCRRVRAAGYELRFARDAFVHHWQSAAFSLLDRNDYCALVSKNTELFQAKWREAVIQGRKGAAA